MNINQFALDADHKYLWKGARPFGIIGWPPTEGKSSRASWNKAEDRRALDLGRKRCCFFLHGASFLNTRFSYLVLQFSVWKRIFKAFFSIRTAFFDLHVYIIRSFSSSFVIGEADENDQMQSMLIDINTCKLGKEGGWSSCASKAVKWIIGLSLETIEGGGVANCTKMASQHKKCGLLHFYEADKINLNCT